ncbi:DNA polymerase ligase N-terminal domain-containing protein [Streptomyces phytohabitans]|uniref:DNA polymerase ligase N-terminal domain-containing protein n=1 Tax=Streptomyces phytohabitans TaxID=1150371 RepID=UPI00345C5C1E
MGGDGRLRAYGARRHFDRTAEPRGGHDAGAAYGDGPDARPDAASPPCFVVQLHDARRTHFDFRLEVDGVLVSWAVPRGPSTDPRDKRLAVPTEDHPLEYREFEGVIAEGEYGAGTVLVWDEGTYTPLTAERRRNPLPFAEALRAGHVSFRLDGAKLHGVWALTRFRGGTGGGDGDRAAWLLVKERGGRGRTARRGGSPDPVRARSTRTGRTLRQVAAEAG